LQSLAGLAVTGRPCSHWQALQSLAGLAVTGRPWASDVHHPTTLYPQHFLLLQLEALKILVLGQSKKQFLITSSIGDTTGKIWEILSHEWHQCLQRGRGPSYKIRMHFTHTQHPEQEVKNCCPSKCLTKPPVSTLGWKLQEKASEGCLIASGGTMCHWYRAVLWPETGALWSSCITDIRHGTITSIKYSLFCSH